MTQTERHSVVKSIESFNIKNRYVCVYFGCHSSQKQFKYEFKIYVPQKLQA